MNTYIVSDMHFGHASIIKYCNRPFKTVDNMNNSLIRNWNSRIKHNDVVYHVGDFCFRHKSYGSKNSMLYWEDQLNGKIIHIKGNHDNQNNVKAPMISALMEFANYKILVQHRPIQDKKEFPKDCDFVICGHVHEKWRYKTIKGIIHINVSCEVQKYMPVPLNDIVNLYIRIKREKKGFISILYNIKGK